MVGCQQWIDIIKKHSNFVGFPIFLNQQLIKTVGAIWLQEKSSITPEQHTAFYRHISGSYDEPTYRLHFSSDAPIALKALVCDPLMTWWWWWWWWHSAIATTTNHTNQWTNSNDVYVWYPYACMICCYIIVLFPRASQWKVWYASLRTWRELI